eukprot:2073235-Pleurochrysis_carterae.AAC.2
MSATDFDCGTSSRARSVAFIIPALVKHTTGRLTPSFMQNDTTLNTSIKRLPHYGFVSRWEKETTGAAAMVASTMSSFYGRYATYGCTHAAEQY